MHRQSTGTQRPRSFLAMATMLAIIFSTLGAGSAGAETESSFALSTAFSYQGRLEQRAQPADGVFDFTFELYDAPTGGVLLGTLHELDLPVEDGHFAVDLDFGVDVFAGGDYWVESEVREAGSGAYSPLGARRRLSAGSASSCVVDSDVEINGGLFVDAQGAVPDIVTACCNDVDDGGQIQIGGFLSSLAMDSGEIQTKSLAGAAPLLINADGGNVGIGVQQASAPLHLPGGPDAEPSAGGALIVGPLNGGNVAIDGNEIMARSNGQASTLHLNADGGLVRSGGPLTVGGQLGIGLEAVKRRLHDTDKVEASCPAGKAVLGGGCFDGSVPPGDLEQSYPLPGLSGWGCQWDADGVVTAYAICARVVP